MKKKIMKRTYIKPECELLPGETNGILCASITYGLDGQKITENSNEDDIPGGGGAREFGDFYDDEY